MALGNNFSMGQARGKARPVLVKRTKEVYNAKDFTEILSTAGQGTNACGLSLGTNTHYHDGSSNLPVVDDKIYSIKRASATYYLANGHYKMHHASDDRTTANIEISSGVVTRVTGCP
jgi:hypothetical protein